MKTPNLDIERSEKKLSINDFLKYYNEDLPSAFPKASMPFLIEFKKMYSGLFKNSNDWSLEQHRKKFMDWRPQRTKSLS